MAKSIVDHKIADNETIQWASVVIDDWDSDFKHLSDYSLNNLPLEPKLLFKQFYDTYLSETNAERRTQYNSWTNGEFEIIFKAYDSRIKAIEKEFEDMLNKSVEKLSNKTKEFYRTSIENANNPDRQKALAAKGRLYNILVKNWFF
ncbi:hypothetical protein KR093_001064 [Drosophila rubida]|uniref:Uncharacterized protein n=1 Tax=Drosophila rubida TaxID=30044 RepID=A0AAD4K4G2_9MUSC|nr:hypothetical protein KR093_001064 [Drosophila rubida]